MLSQIPIEVIRDIFSLCDPASITLACREFASIAHSIHSLWSSIYLGPLQLVPDAPDHLRRRLNRAGTMSLEVSIGPVSSGADMSVMHDICMVLSDFISQLDRLQVAAATSAMASEILGNIFPQPQTPLPLRVFSILLEEDGSYTLPRVLDQLLESPVFSQLETLRIPTHFDCVPICSFNRLHTLLLDGYMEEESPSLSQITSLLHFTPNLETLWLKTLTVEQHVNVTEPSWTILRPNEQNIHVPVLLPKLTRLAISTPGAGSDLIYCIEAPALYDLHLDGSRGPRYQEMTGEDFTWWQTGTIWVQESLKRLATRSPGLRRMAITSTYLTREGWSWLLTGNGEGAPFPQLESLSLHDLLPRSGTIECGLDDRVLIEYANQSSVSLRRLSLHHCTLDLGGESIVQLFGRIAVRSSGSSDVVEEVKCELGVDLAYGGVKMEHIEALVQRGVKVVFHKEEGETVEWWGRSYDINWQADGSDSYAYF
jgi:hypothetical protein